MGSPFRLKSDTMFSRPEESNKEPPLRIVFLSVEGNKTEQNYFEWIEKYREQLGIKSKVHVHSLRRSQKDTLSAPEHVLELLEEYVEIREAEVLPKRMRTVIPTEYTDDFVKRYIENPEQINATVRDNFEMLLQQAGIDLEYEYFLKEYSGKYDVFGVVVDRDCYTHSVTQMNKIEQECREKGYRFFITTPCFEFWLLMHLVDICNIYADDLQEFRNNAKKSKKHTFTSFEVSRHAHHSKGINEDTFKKYYLSKVDSAIRQTKERFSTDIDELIGTDESDDMKKGKLGSNLPDLFDLLRDETITTV
ncbi:MAG: RloB family protein [Clostridiales bacterium]|nr:RloB family protein [Clostridiales bacterium]